MAESTVSDTAKRTATSTEWREMVLLSLSGMLIVGLFAAQHYVSARDDFYVAHHFPNLIPPLQTCWLGFGVAFFLVMLASSRLRHVDPKRGLKIILFVFAAVALIALFTRPTRSQDIYWSLLMGKAFSHYHMNPYRITPAALENDPWAYPVLTWKDLPMMYGPLWTLVIAGIARVAVTLRTALFVAKLFFLAIVVVSGWIYWELLTVLEPTPARRLQKLALLAWNPFVIQTTLVDMHNDALLMLAISASVWLLLKKRFALSSLLLIIGGFIKYAPWILIPVPFFYLIKEGRAHLGKTAQILALLAASALGLLLLLYLPFGGFSPETYSGIQKQLSHIGLATEYLPGTALILQIFPMSFGALYGWGMLVGAGAEIVCLLDNRVLQAFTFPLLLIFFFASPWFQPWYMLWILPVLAVYLSPMTFTLISIFLGLTPELFSPLTTSYAFITVAFVFHFLRASYAAQGNSTS